MSRLPLKQQSILPRIDGIAKDTAKLRQLLGVPEGEFYNEDKPHFDVAKLRLREALEGVFHIGAHVLSRYEGGRTTEYKEIATKLGEFGIVDKSFAEGTLVRMAGYRNRLTHFYAEISAQEMRRIIEEHLEDFETFLAAIKRLLERPEKFGLEIE